MNTLKQRLESILEELDLGIKRLTMFQNTGSEGLLSNSNITVEHLKDLKHILTVAKKITLNLITDNTSHKTKG